MVGDTPRNESIKTFCLVTRSILSEKEEEKRRERISGTEEVEEMGRELFLYTIDYEESLSAV